MPTIGILSPGYPHIPGGVTDHTGRLSKHWTGWGVGVDVITDPVVSSTRLIERFQRTGVDALLIQYVPFLYGKRGLSRFPLAATRVARKLGIRVTTFVHEPWVPPTRLPWMVLSYLQRRQLLQLASESDSVVTAVPAWSDILGNNTELTYVGSTLGDLAGDTTTEPLAESPVVFSPLAAGLRWDWITAAVREVGALPGLIAIGADDQTMKAAHLEWTWLGHLPPQQALQTLARARLVLAPFIDGATGRRTSLMAALSAGPRVVSSRGHLFDDFFATDIMQTPATEQEFIDSVLTTWNTPDTATDRRHRLAWYEEHLSPERLDRRLLNQVIGATE